MSQNFDETRKLLARAERVIPSGSQTFSKSKEQYPLGCSPLFLDRGLGGRVWDVDGNQYLDMVSALLPIVLGYCDIDVDQAIQEQLKSGISFSLSSRLEVELAEKLVEIIPCAEMVRFGKNGSDATAGAVRVARAFTNREHIVALGYHGWQDWYVGATVRNKGVPKSVAQLTHKLPYNDLSSIKKKFDEVNGDVAAVILEPMSIVDPESGFLENLRDFTAETDSLLIFDEIITGFRFALGGAQEYFGVTPDLATFGKAMGNGMPISAIVGREEVMLEMEEVFFSGTFGGETLSLSAALATIRKMEAEPVIDHIWNLGQRLYDEVTKRIRVNELSSVINLGGKAPWSLFSFQNSKTASSAAIRTRFIQGMLGRGVLMQSSHNICYAHTDDDIDQLLKAYDEEFSLIASELEKGILEAELSVPVIEPVFQVRQS